jgi:hypothetical protein
MSKSNPSANALRKRAKHELHARSRALEETDTRGNKIRTLARITVEWTPDLTEKEHREMDRIYLSALEDIRHILSF